jgi:hypothetical protein
MSTTPRDIASHAFTPLYVKFFHIDSTKIVVFVDGAWQVIPATAHWCSRFRFEPT